MRIAVLFLILCCATLSAAVKQPTFLARRDYPSAGGFVAVGDVTGDGIPDMVAVGLNGDVSTLIGNGDGTFRDAVSSVNFGALSGPALVDLNGDGRMDLVTGGLGGILNGGISVFFSNGDGTFQQPVIYQVNDTVLQNAVVGDFNGDGIPDVVAPGTKGIWLFTGKGGGTFNAGVLTPINSGGVYWAVAADFIGHGKLDVAVSVAPNGLYVLFGKGDGTFQTPALVDAKTQGYIVAGPLSPSGRRGIVVPFNQKIYLSNGNGTFSGPFLAPLSDNNMAIGDVNGDGIPDLVDSHGCVALGLGGVKFAPQGCYATASTGIHTHYSVALAELTAGAAGHNDIVLGLESTVSVLLNRGRSNGTFVDGKWMPVTGASACGAGGDFNGDGKPDLAVPTPNGIVILLGTGKPTAPYATGETLSSINPGCPLTGDVNGDGIPDLLVDAYSLNWGVGVYLGQGDGTFLLASVIPFNQLNALNGISNFVLGDFNRDGKVDVASSTNEMALGNGDGTFQSPGPIIANLPYLGFNSIAAGDVNNDGWTDLLATQGFSFSGELYVMLNNQKGGFTLTTTINDAAEPGGATLTDLNGDGNLDAVVDELINGTAHVYLGDGKGGFRSGQQNIRFPLVDVDTPVIGDVNGDGIADLLLAGNGGIGIALGTGKGTFYEPFVVGAGPGVGQVLLQNLQGQPASGGLPDLVAPDWSGGVMVLYNITK
jgi:hypothetical protein